MNILPQKERAELLRRFHYDSSMLVLPNVWDAASARIVEQAGGRAVATSSSGVAAALGYNDGQKISREMLIETIERITRVVACPVTADIEAGYGRSLEEVLDTVRAVIAAGAVGINIEDSSQWEQGTLVDVAYQTKLLQSLRTLGNELDMPLVINARIDVFLKRIGEPEERLEHAVRRANAYLQAGADCVYPIGWLDLDTISKLVKAIEGPVNILAGFPDLALADLERTSVARVSFGGFLTSSTLGHMRAVAREIFELGTLTKMHADSLSNAEFNALYSRD
ncbi:isocitrate lyase/PEP mutase family protein [Ktedonospora formicarum]|uniref:Carboxyvinyl-carboxyphosphonate phosphorylmutase n=1 Tax=Ktedonospora formicarum TaxID=2778364 RepID=A0A8J3I5A8_9CHLR|nr:isocitrate lyase/phosphoenolpyruvate mutase family protein [Ktedonospora formicarum]GHO46173.1 carboxyvinyl-carboxyphosphonate phosphorylmutase [Ktedonospora formicarum]